MIDGKQKFIPMHSSEYHADAGDEVTKRNKYLSSCLCSHPMAYDRVSECEWKLYLPTVGRFIK